MTYVRKEYKSRGNHLPNKETERDLTHSRSQFLHFKRALFPFGSKIIVAVEAREIERFVQIVLIDLCIHALGQARGKEFSLRVVSERDQFVLTSDRSLAKRLQILLVKGFAAVSEPQFAENIVVLIW